METAKDIKDTAIVTVRLYNEQQVREIADKAWEAGRNREHERWTAFPGQPKFPNKETFMKSLFPLKEI